MADLNTFLCNTGKCVGCLLESIKCAKRNMALVMRGEGGGRWRLSVAKVPW